jgi:hypothetical protein
MERIMAKDKNADGRLTPEELTENERQMLRNADLNGDGAVDRQELAAVGQGGAQPGNLGGVNNGATGAGRRGGNDAMGRFFQADRNRDGKLSADEVPADSAGMMRAADLNGDGGVDASEMQAFSARMGDRMRAFGTGAAPNVGNANDPRNRRRPPRN